MMHCSFCGKSSEEVEMLIVGPGVNICTDCLEICNEILAEERLKRAEKEKEDAK